MTSNAIRKSRLLPAFLLLLLVSCHSEFVSLKYDIFNDAYWNQDSTKVAFVASKEAFLKATGIQKFPDGGRAKMVLREIDLYVLNVEDNELEKKWHFDDLSKLPSNISSSLNVKIVLNDSLLLFSIFPVTDWDFYLKFARSAADSSEIKNLKARYSVPFSWKSYEGGLSPIDSSAFRTAFKSEKRISLSDINAYLEKISLEDMGLNIMALYPKAEKDYIEETIFLKNDSWLSRRAVIEQIISKLDKTEIRALLEEMESYANSLDGVEKSAYEIYSRETYEKIEALL